MLTKWGAALGLASAGRVVAGGGGGPLGDATVWPAVLDWSLLSTIPGPLRMDDRVGVGDLVPGYGVAQYDGTDWRLVQAVFPTVADMLAFNELINWGAIAVVGTGVETDPAYFYTGSAWERMPDGVPFAWTLSSLDDFSAIGLQDGDYGVYTAPAGGLSVVLRYKASVPRESGAGSGFVPAWLPPEVYAGNPRLQAYLVGTESVTTDVTLNAQGWGVVSRTVGTITTQTTRVRLATTGLSANVRIETQPVLTTTSKVYARALTRMQIGSGSGTSTAFFSHPAVNNGTTGVNPAYVSSDPSKGTFFWNSTGSAGSTGFDKTPQAAIAGLTSNDDMVEVIVNTAGGARTCELYRNGILVSTTDQVSAPGIADRVTYQAASFNTASASLATADISQVQVFTW